MDGVEMCFIFGRESCNLRARVDFKVFHFGCQGAPPATSLLNFPVDH